jgi:site-specific DNA recombinase
VILFLKTGIYVRVSTEEQAKEGFSIMAQEDKLKDYVKIKDWQLYDVYIDDGISGKNIEGRPEVNRLIADVVKGEVENVLVFKIDRLTRSTKDLISLVDLFNDHDCAFNSLMESIDTHTPSGRMFIKIIGIFAEFERENIVERVSIAFEKKVKEGYFLSMFNNLPYGYSRQIGQREITVSVEEARIVREIFDLYLRKHKTFTAIATELNMRNIPSSTGAVWGGAAIHYMLTNPVYMGKVRYQRYDERRYFEAEGKHEAIISEELFLAVQDKIAKIRRIHKKRPREENYFCGTLMCSECGSKMTTHGQYAKDKGSYYNSYICTQKRNGCRIGSFAHKKVEIAFREYIEGYEDLEVEPSAIITAESNTEDKEKLKAELETGLARLLKKEKDIMSFYIGDKIDYGDYSQMLSLIKGEKKSYESKIAELENVAELPAEIIVDDIVRNFRENWELLTNVERIQFLQTYIEAIYIAKEQDKEIPNKQHVKIKRLEFYQK